MRSTVGRNLLKTGVIDTPADLVSIYIGTAIFTNERVEPKVATTSMARRLRLPGSASSLLILTKSYVLVYRASTNTYAWCYDFDDPLVADLHRGRSR